jgi:nucleoside-diphosphate-sugar epimerase
MLQGGPVKILVTGGAGYIGSILTDSLLKSNYQVTVVDNFYYKQFSALNHLLHNKNLEIVDMDVRNPNFLNTFSSKFDCVIPLAAIVGAPACNKNPALAHETNLEAPMKILQSISKDQLVIMPTTNSAYGTTPPGIITTEQSPLNPLSQYAKEKVLVENELLKRKNSVSLRLATVFGLSPRMRIDLLVNDLTHRALKDKVLVLFSARARRNYIHVRDVSNAISLILKDPDRFLKHQIFNLGNTSANLTKMELALRIKSKMKDLIIIEENVAEDPDQRDYIVSNERIENLGFECEFSLDDGIDELIKFYRLIPAFNFGNV